MEFLEDDAWQLKISFWSNWAIGQSTYLFYKVFLTVQQEAHNLVLKSIFLQNLLIVYTRQA